MGKKRAREVTKAKSVRLAKHAAARRPAARRTKTAAAPAVDEAAVMAAWQKSMTPSEGHRRLEPLVGSWRARTTFAMAPGAPPQVSEGTSEHRFVLGGRYLEQVYRGTSMGMPFEGLGYTGYDNAQDKYVGSWMDSFGTGIMNSVGVGRPTDEMIESVAEAIEPSGKRVRFSCKVRIQDRDHHSFEMWTKAPDGRRFRAMLIEYARK